MLYKFYIKNVRIVPQTFDLGAENVHKWDEEQADYSKSALFHELHDAKAFAQRHTPIPLVWEDNFDYGMFTAVAGVQSTYLELIIVREDLELEPAELLAIPTDFRSTERDPD